MSEMRTSCRSCSPAARRPGGARRPNDGASHSCWSASCTPLCGSATWSGVPSPDGRESPTMIVTPPCARGRRKQIARPSADLEHGGQLLGSTQARMRTLRPARRLLGPLLRLELRLRASGLKSGEGSQRAGTTHNRDEERQPRTCPLLSSTHLLPAPCHSSSSPRRGHLHSRHAVRPCSATLPDRYAAVSFSIPA